MRYQLTRPYYDGLEKHPPLAILDLSPEQAPSTARLLPDEEPESDLVPEPEVKHAKGAKNTLKELSEELHPAQKEGATTLSEMTKG